MMRRIGTKGIWTSLLAQKEKRDSLALTRVLTNHEAALQLNSPKGLLLHREVGTGKIMLIDLFADCLPNRKKRQWHFNIYLC
jgi:peroxisome-assembly ATPase